MMFFIIVTCFLIFLGAVHIKLLRKDISLYYHESKVKELRHFENWYYIYVVFSTLFIILQITVI